jgi:hypothetical protein
MKRSLGQTIRRITAVLALIVVVAAGVLLIINRLSPTASADPDHLDPLALAQLDEFAHLHRTLGDAVWPGFGDQTVPVVVYNEANVFLAGLADPAPGWRTVPGGRSLGGDWQPVDAPALTAGPLYRQPLPPSGETPQAFTVGIGDQFAASLGTMEWMPIALADQIRGELPPPLAAIFPYRLFTGQLLSGTDQYLSLLAHEAFHAHQAAVAPAKLAAAEASLAAEAAYPWEEPAVIDAWQLELDTLAEALRAATPEETAAAAARFLAGRAARREATGLSAEQIALERQREWSEGLARYIELAIWEAAVTDATYESVPTLAADPGFDGYANYEGRWEREIDQMRRMADDPGEGRFYYSGMAIATLLDRLSPGWKDGAMAPGVYLEDLLADALDARG